MSSFALISGIGIFASATKTDPAPLCVLAFAKVVRSAVSKLEPFVQHGVCYTYPTYRPAPTDIRIDIRANVIRIPRSGTAMRPIIPITACNQHVKRTTWNLLIQMSSSSQPSLPWFEITMVIPAHSASFQCPQSGLLSPSIH